MANRPELDDAPSPVFVSYARSDERHARALVAALEAAGHTVWWDGLIQGGEGWSQRIADALDRACAVVVLWSEAALASNWVRDEAQIGAERGRLVPVSLDGSLPPLGFRQFQTIPYDNGRAESVARIAAAVGAVAGTPAIPRQRPAAPAPNRRALLIGGGAALAATASGVAAWRGGWFTGQAPPRSVAVLPFDTIGADKAQAYFADGVAAEIRATLARNPQLSVVANTSSAAASGDARAIAERLNVAYLLDGNVRRAGDRVRVAAELVDPASGYSAWSQTFDRPAADVFAVQDEIAGAVTAALSARLTGNDASVAPGGTASLAAYDAYLRGRGLYERASGEADDRAALAAFDAAVAADPRYADAHAARSRALTVIANQYSQGEARRALYGEAVAAAQTATGIAPASAAAQSALGFALFYGRLDVRGAEGPYQRSARAGAGDADVLSRYALFMTRTARFDAARAALDRARALDPLNARLDWLRAELALDSHHYPDAIPAAEAALAKNPKIGAANAAIGAARLLQNDATGALAAYSAEANPLFGLAGIAIARRRLGQAAEAEGALARLRRDYGDNGLYQQAQVHAQWGDAARAVEALRRARATGDAGLTHLATDPLLDPLRRTPGFIALRRELGWA